MVRKFKEFDYPTMYRGCYIGVAIPIKMIESYVPINLVNTKNFHIIDLIFC